MDEWPPIRRIGSPKAVGAGDGDEYMFDVLLDRRPPEPWISAFESANARDREGNRAISVHVQAKSDLPKPPGFRYIKAEPDPRAPVRFRDLKLQPQTITFICEDSAVEESINCIDTWIASANAAVAEARRQEESARLQEEARKQALNRQLDALNDRFKDL